MTKILSALALLFFFINAFAQNSEKSFTVKYISDAIQLDGALDEPIWAMAESANTFQQYFPSDSIPAGEQSDIKMLYDDKNLYIGIRINTIGKDYVIPSLERDFRAGGNDNISLLFDTFNDGTNAFLFGINPLGVRREALITNGGSGLNGFTTSWDIKWKGESVIYDNYYTAELVIPLTSFKFREGETKWRFNSYRFDMQSNEQSTWFPIPQNQLIFNLAFMGDMIFEKGLGKSRTPLALIPYVNGISSKDFDANNNISNFGVGADAKISVGNSLNLDLTLNPDFSTVEVDNFITNLTRFEIALPERRQFFIDNNDLFGGFGGGRDANPFFSRRIGIATDTAGNSIENRILGGLRLSGKINNDLRVGFLNLQTQQDIEKEIPSNNNMMFSLQQKMFSRSNLGVFFINRQAVRAADFLPEDEEFNRVIGIDYNLASADNSWIGKFYAHKSFQPNDSEGNHSLGFFLGKNTRNFSAFVDAVKIDEEFSSDLGFIPRTDIVKLVNIFEGRIWPKKGIVNNYEAQIFNEVIWRPGLDFDLTDHAISLQTSAEFKSLEQISAQVSRRFVFLTDEFEPTGADGAVPLPGNLGYNFISYQMAFESDQRKIFSYSIEPGFGGFFNGNRYSLETGFDIRLQPKVRIGFNAQYDRIALPQPFSSADIILLSPRLGVTFSKSIFWSTLVQYSNQRDNLGINSRLQWRFAPLSDLFIVYNDNYSVDLFAPRFRSINLKLSYWLNI